MHVIHGHFLLDVEMFDNKFFGVGAAEAAAMDPQQRLWLEVGYSALVTVGYSKQSLMDSNVGVFSGFSNASDWCIVKQNDGSTLTAHSNLGGDVAAIAGRISFVLGLKVNHSHSQ